MSKNSALESDERRHKNIASANSSGGFVNSVDSLKAPPYQLSSANEEMHSDLSEQQAIPFNFGENENSNLVAVERSPAPLKTAGVKDSEQTSTENAGQTWTPPALAGESKLPDMEFDQIGKEMIAQLKLYVNSDYANNYSSELNDTNDEFLISCGTDDPVTIQNNIQQLGMIFREKKREVELKIDQERWQKEDAESERRSALSIEEREAEDKELRVAEINGKIDERMAKAKRQNAKRPRNAITDKENNESSPSNKKSICLHGNFCPEIDPIMSSKKTSDTAWWGINLLLSKVATFGPFKLEIGPNRLDCDDFVLYDTKGGWFPQRDKCDAKDVVKATVKEAVTSKIKAAEVINKTPTLSGGA